LEGLLDLMLFHLLSPNVYSDPKVGYRGCGEPKPLEGP